MKNIKGENLMKELCSKNYEWETPPELVKNIEEYYGKIELDVCATEENAKAPEYYTKKEDGLIF